MAKPSLEKRLAAACAAVVAVFSAGCTHRWESHGVELRQRKGHRGRVGLVKERCADCGEERVLVGLEEKNR